MSHHRISPEAGFVDQKTLPRGPNGRALCRQCGIEVPQGRRTFCSDACVDLWRLKTDPGFVRSKVFERDRGVCATCGLDTAALERTIARMHYRDREAYLQGFGLRYEGKSLWQADHIVPVVEGGGECDAVPVRRRWERSWNW